MSIHTRAIFRPRVGFSGSSCSNKPHILNFGSKVCGIHSFVVLQLVDIVVDGHDGFKLRLGESVLRRTSLSTGYMRVLIFTEVMRVRKLAYVIIPFGTSARSKILSEF